MTYLELIRDADRKLDTGEITLGEYERMIAPLKQEMRLEVIHCRDCKYWREHKYAKETKRYIPFCGFNAIYTKADDFCSKAERRTE